MDAAIFLDKDGTLIHDVPYNVDPGRMTLSPGAVAGLRQLQQAGYRLVVVSNQSGVARGYFDETALEGVARRLCHLLEAHQVYLDGFYYCPHHPSGVGAAYRQSCDCRKPLPGMLLRAAAE
ncbi:MAG: HAD-IIIA family hydrolase, partial [Dehalococcoidia bacterium]|nr:HAD-IIIA family hydrolase [Dehalococcoidia bacterium]